MTALYAFHHLDPRPNAANPILDTPCLGIEVTTAALAARCSLGNIDPQHGQHRPMGDWPVLTTIGGMPCQLAACDFAARNDFWVTRAAPLGCALVTVRPDCDSTLTMAEILLAAIDREHPGTIGLHSPAVAKRIALVAERDGFTPGAEWAPRALPTEANLWPTTAAPVSETESLAPLGAICSPGPGQTQMSLALRVAVTACWLLWGESRGDATVAARIYEACGATWAGRDRSGPTDAADAASWTLSSARHVAEEARLGLARAVASGEIKIRVALGHSSGGGCYVEGDGLTLSLHEYENDFSYTGSPARVAVVESAHRGALGLGYCFAPVVVAVMPGSGARKATIAAWRPGLLDFEALREALNTAEIAARCAREREADYIEVFDATIASEVRANGWGGGATILGSPQGEGSVLSSDDIVRAVLASLGATRQIPAPLPDEQERP